MKNQQPNINLIFIHLNISWTFTTQYSTHIFFSLKMIFFFLFPRAFLIDTIHFKAVNCLHHLTLPFLWYSLFSYAGLDFVDFSSIFVLATQLSFWEFSFFFLKDDNNGCLAALHPIWHTYFRSTDYFNPPPKRTGLFIHFVCVLFLVVVDIRCRFFFC